MSFYVFFIFVFILSYLALCCLSSAYCYSYCWLFAVASVVVLFNLLLLRRRTFVHTVFVYFMCVLAFVTRFVFLSLPLKFVVFPLKICIAFFNAFTPLFFNSPNVFTGSLVNTHHYESQLNSATTTTTDILFLI